MRPFSYICDITYFFCCFFFFQAEDGIRDRNVTGVQTCALPISLHADPTFARFLQRIGQLALRASDPATIEQIARLFWFTVEFGLVREEGEVRLYEIGRASCRERG